MKRAVVVLLLLSACGGRQVLKPENGKPFPVKPAAAKTTPTADELIVPDDQARPQRNDELLLKSERRRDDPFDLPPKH